MVKSGKKSGKRRSRSQNRVLSEIVLGNKPNPEDVCCMVAVPKF